MIEFYDGIWALWVVSSITQCKIISGLFAFSYSLFNTIQDHVPPPKGWYNFKYLFLLFLKWIQPPCCNHQSDHWRHFSGQEVFEESKRKKANYHITEYRANQQKWLNGWIVKQLWITRFVIDWDKIPKHYFWPSTTGQLVSEVVLPSCQPVQMEWYNNGLVNKKEKLALAPKKQS